MGVIGLWRRPPRTTQSPLDHITPQLQRRSSAHLDITTATKKAFPGDLCVAQDICATCRSINLRWLVVLGEDIFEAVAAGDLRRIKDIVEAGSADVNALNAQGHSCLYAACDHGFEACALFLLGKLNDDRIRADRDRCLVSACSRGLTQVVRQLLGLGANVEAKAENGDSALHGACSGGHAAVISILVEAGANVNAVTSRTRGAHFTPLASLCGYRFEALALYLLDKGADPLLCDRGAFFGACVRGLHSFVRTVLERFPREVLLASGKRGLSPLHVTSWHPELTALLIAHGADVNAADERGVTPLNYYARYADARLVRALLDAGADMDARCHEYGRTALTYALLQEDRCEVHSDEPRQNANVDVLLERGATIHTRDNRGVTPFHTACAITSMHRMTQFLALGASVDAEDDDGCTPLARACGEWADRQVRAQTENPYLDSRRALPKRHLEVVRALFARGTDFGSCIQGDRLGISLDAAAWGRPVDAPHVAAVEKAVCGILLAAYASRDQPLAAPRALRWLMARLRDDVDDDDDVWSAASTPS